MATKQARISKQGQSLLPFENLELNTKDKGSAFNDPAFASNKILPIHRWVPWIAGFSKEFVSGALTKYLPEHGTVLDPFSGVGTTLVEAVLHGHNAIGFEINPYAALACRTKLNAHKVDVKDLRNEIVRLIEFYDSKSNNGYDPKSAAPQGFKTRAEFYSPKVLRKVLIIQDFINGIKESAIQDLFRLAFTSTMVSYSNYSYEPSLGQRVSAGKQPIEDFPVGQSVLGKLSEIAQDSDWVQSQLRGSRAASQVINDSFFQHQLYVKPGTVDLLITSPPYLNNYHYNRNTRPQIYWLGYAENPNDLVKLENANFGKYWQTVRTDKSIDLTFSLPGSDISDRLQHLRTLNPEKGLYGGHGWANYAASYFNDCHRFALATKKVLRRGGTALVVIGNSILQGVMIATDEYLGKIGESIGLQLVGIDVRRATRIGNSIIQSEVRVGKAQDSHKLYEAIVEFRKR